MAYTTIKKPSSYFNTKLYAGNSSAGHAITGVGFQPDWTWIRERDAANHHIVVDAVRGATKYLLVNDTQAEVTSSNYVSSFDSDGFTVGADPGTNRGSMVAWNWLASNTTASNTDGSITSTVSANTTSGFSIVSYTGTGSAGTVGHGLGAVPKMIIIKGLTNTSAENWRVFHNSVSYGRLVLNDTDGVGNSTDFGADGSGGTITQNINYFNIGTDPRVNASGDEFIAYCFADVKGFSKFGSYTGNGSTDGTFVYTGFKPAFLLWKQTNISGQTWGIFDNKRDPHNFVSLRLIPNASDAEGSASDAASCDFLSNGFKWRSSFASRNGSGDSYIYMAFAEEPLVGDNPATAR